MTKKLVLYVLALAAISLSVSACGVRPKNLKPPADSTAQYPRTYPAPDAE